MAKLNLQSDRLDKVAISLSAICLLHCLLTPVVITLVPILTSSALAQEDLFHQLLLWAIIPISASALFIGCRKHRNFSILFSGSIGMSILVLAAFLGHDVLSHSSEQWLTVLGGLVLAYSHYLNYKACQSISCGASDCQAQHHH